MTTDPTDPVLAFFGRRRAALARFAPRLRTSFVLGTALALILGVVLLRDDAVARQTSRADAAGADQTLRDFLTAGAVDHNAYMACQYLTTSEQQQVVADVPSSNACRDAFTWTAPQIGGVDSLHTVNALRLRTVVRGDQAVISATGRATRPLRFTLDRTTAAEYATYRAPIAAWRVASGVPALLPAPAGAASSTRA